MIAGELPADPAALSPGSGPVDVYDNLVQANLANDDGGGIRFLMAGNFPINVYNNMVVNNVSTHEGGGIAIDDAPNMRVFNNTVMKNITTATAVTSNGSPAPAGLSTGQNSGPLQATLPAGSPTFSDPLLFNNVFWDNRAGSRAPNGVSGVGAAGDLSPINYWDMGTADGSGVLSPTNTVLQTALGTNPSGSNSSTDPAVVTPYDVSVGFNAWRTNINFLGAILVAVEVPPNLLGDYHVPTTSSAVNRGAASKAGVDAPTTDYDGNARPGAGGLFDAGADEVVSTAPPSRGGRARQLQPAQRPAGGQLGRQHRNRTVPRKHQQRPDSRRRRDRVVERRRDLRGQPGGVHDPHGHRRQHQHADPYAGAAAQVQRRRSRHRRRAGDRSALRQRHHHGPRPGRDPHQSERWPVDDGDESRRRRTRPAASSAPGCAPTGR